MCRSPLSHCLPVEAETSCLVRTSVRVVTQEKAIKEAAPHLSPYLSRAWSSLISQCPPHLGMAKCLCQSMEYGPSARSSDALDPLPLPWCLVAGDHRWKSLHSGYCVTDTILPPWSTGPEEQQKSYVEYVSFPLCGAFVPVPANGKSTGAGREEAGALVEQAGRGTCVCEHMFVMYTCMNMHVCMCEYAHMSM